eukprot:m.6425 g.6425  ORF g.6425 m.6425 type:complete len:353 (-) comp3532_c0_seq2:35-1093(-)
METPPRETSEASASERDKSNPRIDIQDIIEIIEKLENLTAPISWVVQRITSILCWKSPGVTVLVFLVILICCIFLPDYLSAMCFIFLGGTILWGRMLTTPQANLQFDEVWEAADRAAQEAADAAKESNSEKVAVLKKYFAYLVRFYHTCKILLVVLEDLIGLWRWTDPPRSRKFVAVCVAGAVLCTILGAGQVMVLVSCLVFYIGRQYEGKDLWSVLPEVKDEGDRESIYSSAEDGWIDVDMEDENMKRLSNAEVPPAGNDTDSELRFRKDIVGHVKPVCSGCQVLVDTIFRKRVYCRACGHQFCSQCCNSKIPRALFGATSPMAQKETVRVCQDCKQKLGAAQMGFADDDS